MIYLYLNDYTNRGHLYCHFYCPWANDRGYVR